MSQQLLSTNVNEDHKEHEDDFTNINQLKDCSTTQLLFIMNNFAFEEIRDKNIIRNKDCFTNYFEENKVDGQSFINMKPQQFSTNIIQHNDGNKALNEPSNKLYGYLMDFDVQRLKSSLSASYSSLISPHPFEMYIGVDFGTDSCGLAYAFNDGNVYIHNTKKIKSCVLFDADGGIQGIGNDAKQKYTQLWTNDGWKLFEKFKIHLYQEIELRRIKASNDKKLSESMETIFVALLKYLKENQVKQFLTKYHKQIGGSQKKQKIRQKKSKYDDIQWIISMPAVFSQTVRNKFKEWAITAGLINGSIPNHLKIVYDTDCLSLSLYHAINMQSKQTMIEEEKKENIIISAENKQTIPKYGFVPPSQQKEDIIIQTYSTQINTDIGSIRNGDKYLMIDVGGGLCKVSCHQIQDIYSVSQVLAPTGGLWGFANVQDKFEILLRDIFSDEMMDEFLEQTHGLSLYQEILQNFINTADKAFTVNARLENTDYHNLPLPMEFGEFLLDKFENNDENLDGMEYLDQYIANRCEYQYGDRNIIQFTENELKLHRDLWKILFNFVIDPVIDHIKGVLSELDDISQKSPTYQWEWQTNNGDWKSFKNDISTQIEQLAVNESFQFKLGARSDTYEIEKTGINKGIQVNKSTKSDRNIRKTERYFATCKWIFLVGGFANNLYYQSKLKEAINEKWGYHNIKIIIPIFPELCVVDGAARYGLYPHFIPRQSDDEKDNIKSPGGKATEKSIASCYATVEEYFDQRWYVAASGEDGWSEVHLCQDIEDNSYRLVSWTAKSQKVSTSEIYFAFVSVSVFMSDCVFCDLIGFDGLWYYRKMCIPGNIDIFSFF